MMEICTRIKIGAHAEVLRAVRRCAWTGRYQNAVDVLSCDEVPQLCRCECVEANERRAPRE